VAASPGTSGDNMMVLTLGSAAVLAVTGFAVLRVRRRRTALTPMVWAYGNRLPTVAQVASEQAILSR
jgi:hypothetical protein